MEDTDLIVKGKGKKMEKKERRRSSLRYSSAASSSTVCSKPEDDMEDFKTAFSLLDIDNKGEITKADLKTFMESKLGENPTETELQEMITEVDVDGNGSINFTEFLKLMKEDTVDPEAEQDMLEALLVFDTERQGYISADVLSHAMTNIGESLNQLESEDFIKFIDADGDGLINYQELVKILSA